MRFVFLKQVTIFQRPSLTINGRFHLLHNNILFNYTRSFSTNPVPLLTKFTYVPQHDFTNEELFWLNRTEGYMLKYNQHILLKFLCERLFWRFWYILTLAFASNTECKSLVVSSYHTFENGFPFQYIDKTEFTYLLPFYENPRFLGTPIDIAVASRINGVGLATVIFIDFGDVYRCQMRSIIKDDFLDRESEYNNTTIPLDQFFVYQEQLIFFISTLRLLLKKLKKSSDTELTALFSEANPYLTQLISNLISIVPLLPKGHFKLSLYFNFFRSFQNIISSSIVSFVLVPFNWFIVPVVLFKKPLYFY
jgi:hypothetical protein